jgi:cold shock protein
MNGQIKMWNGKMGYGFVSGEDGIQYFFPHYEIQYDENSVCAGQRVTFDVLQSDRGPRAKNIRIFTNRTTPVTNDSQPVVSAPGQYFSRTFFNGTVTVDFANKTISGQYSGRGWSPFTLSKSIANFSYAEIKYETAYDHWIGFKSGFGVALAARLAGLGLIVSANGPDDNCVAKAFIWVHSNDGQSDWLFPVFNEHKAITNDLVQGLNDMNDFCEMLNNKLR